MRKVSGTASSAFRAIWGDLEDQAELSAESGTEHKSNIFKDSSGTPDGKENSKGIYSGKNTSAIVNSPRQFFKEDPTERDLEAITANLNQSNKFGEKLPSAPTKKTENSPPTPSPTKIALPIRSKDNSEKSRDIINYDSNSPEQSCNELHNDKHLPDFTIGPNKNLKEARIFQDSDRPDEILCQPSSKIVQNENKCNGKEADTETDAYKKFVLQDYQAKESRSSNPTKCFDEKKPDDLPKIISGQSSKFPDETTTKTDNCCLNDLVLKKNLEFEASQETRTKDASNISSKIHSSHEEIHNSVVINWSGSDILKNSTKYLANDEYPTIDSNTLLELGNEVTTQNARLKMVDNTPSTIENHYEMCKAIISPIDKDMKLECKDSVNYPGNGAIANNQGILFAPRIASQLCKDENLIKIQDVNATNDNILKTKFIDTLKNNIKSQPEALNILSSNLLDHMSIQEENQVTDNSTELSIQKSEELIENFVSNLSGSELNLVDSTDFTVKDVNCKTTSGPESQSVITEIKAGEDENQSGVTGEQDLKETEKAENETARDVASDSSESIIKEIKAAENEAKIEAEEDQDPEVKDVLVKDSSYDSENDSPRESIITVIKALEDEANIDAEEDQDPEVKDVLVKKSAYDIKSDSPRESINTEIKVGEDENQSGVTGEQDLKETEIAENETARDVASDPSESIIKEIKAAEDEAKIEAEKDQDPEVMDVLVKKSAYDSASDPYEPIIPENKVPENNPKIDSELKDFVTKQIVDDIKIDSPCKSIITKIMLPVDGKRSGSIEEQDLKVTDSVAKYIADDSKSDSLCDSIITEIKSLEIETPDHEPQLSSKEDQSLSSTNHLANHEPHGDSEINRSTLESITSTKKREEKDLHDAELDEFKRVVNSRFLIRNASEESPALFSKQGLKSKINDSDMASENENFIEKSTDKKIRAKRAKFTGTGAAESRTSILSLGSSRENPYRPVTAGANNKFEMNSSKVKQTSIHKKFNANDNGSITTTKVKKSLKEKIMGKISGKLHKIKN